MRLGREDCREDNNSSSYCLKDSLSSSDYWENSGENRIGSKRNASDRKDHWEALHQISTRRSPSWKNRLLDSWEIENSGRGSHGQRYWNKDYWSPSWDNQLTCSGPDQGETSWCLQGSSLVHVCGQHQDSEDRQRHRPSRWNSSAYNPGKRPTHSNSVWDSERSACASKVWSDSSSGPVSNKGREGGCGS